MHPTNPFSEVEIVTHVEVIESAPIESQDQSNVHSEIRTKLFERILSPQSLQVMMMSGGGILAIGFAIWLWSIGLFDNPIVAAVSMGAVNLGMLGAGVWLATRSRFKLAGRGLAFLSSLLLPLHLWFYDAQGLIEVVKGGHLWIPAMIICGLYAMVARLTRDSIFVYNLVGGIVLTGLLFLASPQLAFLWSVVPTCAFLVTVGAVAIHADRFFVERSGAFSRQEFGQAFFRAGQIVLAGGLGYLLFSQTFVALLEGVIQVGSLSIGQNPSVNFWSLPILAVAGWSYAVAHRSRPWGNAYLIAVGTVIIWMGLTALNVFSITITVNLILLFVAVGMLVIQLGVKLFAAKREGHSSVVDQDSALFSVANFMLMLLGLGQSSAALLMPEIFFSTTFFMQVVVTVASLLATTEIGLGEKSSVLSNGRVAGGSLLLTLAAFLALLNWTSLSLTLAIGVVLTAIVVLAVTSQFVAFPQFQRLILWAVGSATGRVLLAAGLLMVVEELMFGSVASLAIVLTCGCLFTLISLTTRNHAAFVGAFITFATAFAQVAVLLNVTSATPIIVSISLIGVSIQFGSTLARSLVSSESRKKLADDSLLDRIGSILIVGGSIAALLYVLPPLCLNQVTGWQAALLLFQLLPLGVGYLLNRAEAWRHSFQALAVATSICAAIAFVTVSTIPVVYRFEIMTLVAGAILLIVGHIGWAKEEQSVSVGSVSRDAVSVKRNETVSLSLTMGGLLLAVPMVIGVIAFRLMGVETADFWRVFHEIGGLAIGLVLLGSGILCRIRSTTLAGAVLLISYVGTLLVLIRLPEELQSISVMMMVGGGAFFAVAILLSIYRDWLLGLPSKIREGEGMFKVLKWR